MPVNAELEIFRQVGKVNLNGHNADRVRQYTRTPRRPKSARGYMSQNVGKERMPNFDVNYKERNRTVKSREVQAGKIEFFNDFYPAIIIVRCGETDSVGIVDVINGKRLRIMFYGSDDDEQGALVDQKLAVRFMDQNFVSITDTRWGKELSLWYEKDDDDYAETEQPNDEVPIYTL